MKLKLKHVEIKDERFMKSYTGISSKTYEILRPVFAEKFAEHLKNTTKSAAERKRKKGGGRKHKLPTIDDKLVFILHYQKAYPTMDNMGSNFDMSRSSACGLVHCYAKILKSSLEQLGVIPMRIMKTPTALLEYLKELGEIETLLIDVTERPYRRLKDPELRKRLYSGKKSDLLSKTR